MDFAGGFVNSRFLFFIANLIIELNFGLRFGFDYTFSAIWLSVHFFLIVEGLAFRIVNPFDAFIGAFTLDP